jgi:hypoxanthine phosphoribosyltransferase
LIGFALTILLTEEQVREGVRRLAGEIAACYAGRPLTIVGVLTGGLVLVADLIRLLHFPLRLGVVQAKSYRDGAVKGSLNANADLVPDVRGRDVLLVDDVLDTGGTLFELVTLLGEMAPRSIRCAVLLSKCRQRAVSVQPDFVGFEIPDRFVVGYGLDYRDAYRNLPYVAALDPEELDAGSEP